MHERLEQLVQLHKICLQELQQLQNNVEQYLQTSSSMVNKIKTHWPEIQRGSGLALIVYDNFLTSITNVMNLSRKFNIQLQLNHPQNDDKSQLFNMFEGHGEHDENPTGSTTEDAQYYREICNNFSDNRCSKDCIFPAEEISVAKETEEEFVYPKQNIKSIYKVGSTIKSFVTYLKDENDLTFYVIDFHSEFVEVIAEISQSIDLHQYYTLPSYHEVFGLVLDKRIIRAVRSPKFLYDQELDEEIWPCYLLDFGEIVHLKNADIKYKLTERQKATPALAMLCQLKVSESLKSQQQKFREMEYQECELKIIEIKEHMFIVELKQTSAELDMLYDEPLGTSNAMKAVMGYDPQDEKRICRFYDPDTGACFKGSNCKQEHVPLHPEGWTKDVLPAVSIVDNRSPTIVYCKGDIINITPTYIGKMETFYAQINDSHHNNSPLIWNDEDIPAWKRLQRPPHVFEMVLSRYEDELWYRAKIIAHDDYYKMFKVFYVDYGNHQIVHLRNLAKCDYGMAQIPFQATLCRLAGVKETNVSPKKRKACIEMLCNRLLNQSVDVKVVSHHEDLIVSLIDEKPLMDMLIEYEIRN